MLEFEFLYTVHPRPIVVTFYTKEEGEYCDVARFRFNSRAFDSVEHALSIFAGLAGNNFVIETSLGFMSVQTDDYVYYAEVPGVIGHAEIKNLGDYFNEYIDIGLYYPESIGIDEIYRLITEDLDIKSFKFNVDQLSDNE